MENFIDLLHEINLVQLIGIGIMLWFFYARLDNKIEKLELKFDGKFEKIDARFEKIDVKFDKLSEKVEDVDRRLCRIEGSLSTSGHCLFNQCKPEQKAE